MGDGLWGESYPIALSCAKIGMGLLSKLIPETSTTRSFEIPAMGTFMLAERTAEHEDLFEDTREAVFFSTSPELQRKVLAFTENAETRSAIAAGGRRRCEKSGYAVDLILGQLLRDVDNAQSQLQDHP
jgi:spore maturation protein CgeB